MIFIKIILVFLLTIAFTLVGFSKKRRRMSMVFMFALFLVSVIFIIFPDFSDTVANRFAFDRGADLIIYLSIAILCLVTSMQYVSIRTLDDKITSLVRNSAKMGVMHTRKSDDEST